MDKLIEFENRMKTDIESVFTNILKEHNYILPISARSRSGAEISDFLEDNFVEYINKNSHPRIYNPTGADKRATKSPYDFCFNYNYKSENLFFDDLIWGDIKATKRSFEDSNPDLGTPEKIIKFIKEGHFYLMFVFFEYEPFEDKSKFVKFSNGKYVKCQFLKDISHTVRINPKPQFQVNINEPEEYRTREEFLKLFKIKYFESVDRIIANAQKKKSKLSERFSELEKCLNNYQKHPN